jgi:NADH dehydrogenase (ubiquinone) Fe-S protein 1
VSPPGAAREDWKIIRAVSDVLGVSLPYEDVYEIRDRLYEVSPTLLSHDVLEPSSIAELAFKTQLVDNNSISGTKGKPLGSVIKNFYFTDAISRSSKTMAQCSVAFNAAPAVSSASSVAGPAASP